MNAKACLALTILAAAAGRGAGVETRLLTDFTRDLPASDTDATVSLRFRGIRELPGGKGDVVVQLQRRAGKWADNGHVVAADYNQKSTNSVELGDLAFDGRRIQGPLKVTIGPDSPRPGRKGLPQTPDVFEIDVSAKARRGQSAPFQPDREAFMPPWRKDTPTFGGELLEGTYRAARGGKGAEGRTLGAVAPAPVRGRFGAEGNVHVTKAPGGGMKLLCRLSPKRVAPPQAAWAVKRLPAAQDWRRYDGLRLTVDSAERRSDAAIAVRLTEADGSTFSVTSAALLLGREVTFDVPFSDFRGTGGNYFLDVDQVAAFALGVDNPGGVGDVEFTVRGIELIRASSGFAAPPTGPVDIEVDWPVRIDFDGQTTVPKGLFGFHDVGHNKPRRPKGVPASPTEHMRRLRCGFLRPLTHVGFGAKPITDEQIAEMQAGRLARRDKPTDAFFARAEAADAVDNVVWCHTQDLWARPSWMDRDRKKVLDGVRAFYRAQAARAWVPGENHNPLRRFEVWNEPFMWGRHVNMGYRNPRGKRAWSDPTQYGYIPAKLGADVYSEIFLAAVAGAKGANPHARLGGMCSPSFNGDDYANFTNYARHFLDRCHAKVDFLTEHHYFGLPASYAASYEVVTAWCDVKYGRRIPIYNTECNDLGSSHANKAYYNIRDILECLRVCPDVARGRAVHALWSGYCRSPGETNAFTLLSALRGRMLAARASECDVVPVVAERPDGRMVVLALNDSNFTRRVQLAVPEGLKPQDVTQLVMKGETRLETVPGGKVALSDHRRLSAELAARECVRWTLAPVGPARDAAVRKLERSSCNVLFARVEPGRSVSGKVVWRGGGPPAKRAILRVVTRDVHRDEGVVVVNGTELPLRWSSSNDGFAVAEEVHLNPAVLAKDTTIEFRCPRADSNGFTVYAAAVLLDK